MTFNSESFINDYIKKSTEVMINFSEDKYLQSVLLDMSIEIADSIRNGGKLLIAGNGGSAADAQHIASEFVVRMNYDRSPMAAIALTTDSSILTSGSNDYGYESVFKRQVLTYGDEGDVFLGISTSGQSPNIINALEVAKIIGMKTFGFTGDDPKEMNNFCDRIFEAPSDSTPIIQQIHIVAAHILCSLVEQLVHPQIGV
jgi:D-sedoheptulose 7-phosphate isomerase